RLGFEVVRNTAITLAVEQIFNAGKHDDVRDGIKAIWEESLALSSMCFVIAKARGGLNADNAFLCGLFNGIGKLYLLSKARDFPGLLGDTASFGSIVEQWNASVGSSIVNAWGFSDDISDSFDLEENLSHDPRAPATLVDIVYTAKLIIDDSKAESRLAETTEPAPAKLDVTAETLPQVREAWSLHVRSMREAAGA
ncbi:MAG: HDOD domain-containing protein, partial [Pseudomonadota bacterium]